MLEPHVDISMEIAQWEPMKDRSDDPSHHERTLLPRSYDSLPRFNKGHGIRSPVCGMMSIKDLKSSQYYPHY